MHDSGIEDRLRVALRGDADGLGLTITTAELERRLVARRRARNGRRLSLIAAGIAIVAVGAIGAMSNGWIGLPAVGTTVSPSPSDVPSGGLQPIPATPGRIEVTRIDPTTPADPVEVRFQGQIKDEFVVLHSTVSCLGDGTLDFSVDGQPQHVDCSSIGESASHITLLPADDVLDYRLATTGRISFGVLVDLQTTSEPPPIDGPSPAAFTPPDMQVSVSTLGVPGETLVLSTGCSFTYVLPDGSSGSGGCPDPGRQVPSGGEMLDVGWGDDVTFTAPAGWRCKDTLVSAADMAAVVAGTVAEPGDELIRVGDTPIPTLTRTGWTWLGDSVVQIRSTFVRGTESFTTTYDVTVHGPTKAPSGGEPTVVCGTPDLSVDSPPAVRMFVDREASVLGEFGTTSWNNSATETPMNPQPAAAIEVAAGAALDFQVAGNVCATSWSVAYGPPPSPDSDGLLIDTVGSLVIVHRDAGDGKENRFSLADLPPGEWFILADFGYPDGSASMGWHVIVK